MGGKQKEACGRCSVTTVIDATEDGEEKAENPFEGERIEIEESEMRSVVRHEVLASKVTDRLDAFASRLMFGRSGK
jgi:hypothetical protein